MATGTFFTKQALFSTGIALALAGVITISLSLAVQPPKSVQARTGEMPIGDNSGREEFVGSQACVPCHQSIYDKFSRTAMGRSMTRVTPTLLANMVSSGSTNDEMLHQQFEVFTREGKLFQSQFEMESSGKELFRETHEIQWIIGSGNNGFAGVVANGPYLFQAPMSFYSRIGGWGLSPGYEFGNYGFNRPILAGCIICHSGQPRAAASDNGRFEEPPFQELAIGCENCHGPGAEHIREMKLGGASGANRTIGRCSIVNPARLTPALADNICMFCHQTGDVRVLKPNKGYRDFRPGQPLDNTLSIFLIPPKRESPPPSDHVEHYYSMTLSKCYRNSERALSCITCHDPHVQPTQTEAPAYFNGKCAECHTDKSCKISLAVRQKQKRPNDCISCHMPKRDIGVILHSSATSHRIMARPDEAFPEAAFHQTTSALPDLVHLSAVPGQEDAKPPNLTLLQAYGELMDKAPEYRERYLTLLTKMERSQPKIALVQASLGRRALLDGKFSEAAAYLQRAAETGPPQALTYADLAEAQAKLGRQDEATTSLAKAVEMDPFNAVFQKKLVLQFIETKQYSKAQSALERYVKTFPQDSFMRQMLSRAKDSEQPR